MNGDYESRIVEKALSLGYDQVGIAPLEDMAGYDERFEERLEKVPESARFYEGLRRLTKAAERHPWAKSVIVVVQDQSCYKIPEGIRGHVALSYLFDSRVNESAPDYAKTSEMNQFFGEIGLRTEWNRNYGVVGDRYAAMQAGLGVIRFNNFFYSDKYGSFCRIISWLADKEMSWKAKSNAKPCPDGCKKCVKACPTRSLSEPFTMSPVKCVSFLTTRGIELRDHPMRKELGGCIYGCDICQQVCPQNRGKWHEEKEFPGVAELEQVLEPESILAMSEDLYKEKVQPKFFYLSPDELWKWQVDALNCMANSDSGKYAAEILNARTHPHEKVRSYAQALTEELALI
jgi:epoxyqueuosine reductase QueG